MKVIEGDCFGQVVVEAVGMNSECYYNTENGKDLHLHSGQFLYLIINIDKDDTFIGRNLQLVKLPKDIQCYTLTENGRNIQNHMIWIIFL